MRATTRKRAAFALTLALTLAVVLSFPAVQPVDAAFVSATPNRWGPLSSRSVSHSSLASSAVTERAASPSSDSATSDDEPKLKTTDLLSLDSIRSTLIRQEETIIFALIERAQYARNAEIYDRDAYATDVNKDRLHPKLQGRRVSFLEAMLFETEQVHARARRRCPGHSPSGFAAHDDVCVAGRSTARCKKGERGGSRVVMNAKKQFSHAGWLVYGPNDSS